MLPELARLVALIGLALLPFVIVSLILVSSTHTGAGTICDLIGLEREDDAGQQGRVLALLLKSKGVLSDRAALWACSDSEAVTTSKY